MDEAGLSALPDTDPETRVLRRGTVGYNVQSVVDGKHHLITDVDVVQDASDIQQMYRMARRTQRQLQAKRMEELADAGYSNGKLLKRRQAHALIRYAPVQRSAYSIGGGRYFDRTEFRHNSDGNNFECPAGETMPKRTHSNKGRDLDLRAYIDTVRHHLLLESCGYV